MQKEKDVDKDEDEDDGEGEEGEEGEKEEGGGWQNGELAQSSNALWTIRELLTRRLAVLPHPLAASVRGQPDQHWLAVVLRQRCEPVVVGRVADREQVPA